MGSGLGGLPPPRGAVSKIFSLFQHSLTYLNTLVNKVDEMQINHSGRALHDGGRTLTAARAHAWIDTKQLTCPNEI